MRWPVLFLLLMIVIPVSGEWTQFKGDPEHPGVAPAIDRNPGTLRWKYIAGGEIESSPCIAENGNIVFTSRDGNVYVVDRRGSLLWSRNVGSPISASPALDGDTIYVVDESGILHTYSLDGFSSWKYRAREEVYHSSPSVDQTGYIYYGTSDGSLISLRTDGVPRWIFRAPDYIDTSPTVHPYDGTVYVGCGDGKLYAIGILGRPKWSFSTGGPISSTPCLDQNVYVASEDGYLYSIWQNGTMEWKTKIEPVHLSSPSTDGERIYVGTLSGRLYCLNKEGSILWSYKTGDGIESSPIICGDRIVFGSIDNGTYCLDKDGDPIWELHSNSWIRSTPAIDEDGTVYIGTGEGALYSVGDPFPGPPRFLIGHPGDTEMSLTWSPPLGGDDLLYYNVYRWNGTDWGILDSSEGPNYTDTGLRNGETYRYAVSAVNDVGEGVMSNTAEGIPKEEREVRPPEPGSEDDTTFWILGLSLVLLILALLIWNFLPHRGKEWP